MKLPNQWAFKIILYPCLSIIQLITNTQLITPHWTYLSPPIYFWRWSITALDHPRSQWVSRSRSYRIIKFMSVIIYFSKFFLSFCLAVTSSFLLNLMFYNRKTAIVRSMDDMTKFWLLWYQYSYNGSKLFWRFTAGESVKLSHRSPFPFRSTFGQ